MMRVIQPWNRRAYSGPMSEHRLPLIPVMETVIFPQIGVPLTLQRPRSIAAAQAGEEAIVVTQRSSAVSEPGLADLHLVGVRGRVVSAGVSCW